MNKLDALKKEWKNQKFDLLVMTYPYGFYINPEILKKHLNKLRSTELKLKKQNAFIIIY